MASLQEILSETANQKSRSAVAQAETAIEIMRKSGYPDQADEFENRIRNAITNKNVAAFDGSIKQLFAFQKKAPIATPQAKEKAPEYTSDELAMRIQDTLSLADERVVDLPNSNLSRLSSFVAKGDTKKASQQLGEISAFIEKAIDTQTKETKKTESLQDGIQVQIGDQSGIRYIGGQPVSKGAINSDVFNSMYQKNAASQQKQFAEAGVPMASSIPLEPSQQYQVAPVEGVVAQPEVYAQAVQTTPTSMEQKQIAMRKASEAYKAGNDEEAVILMNSAGGKGLMGVFTTEDLPTVFGKRVEKPQDQKDNKNKTKSGTSYQIIQE
jgi:hypothetical protein